MSYSRSLSTLSGAEIQTIGCREANCLGSFQMWTRKRIQNMGWVDVIGKKIALGKIGEQRKIWKYNKKR